MAEQTVPIALVMSLSFSYCRHVLRGIRQYARSKEWMLHLIVLRPNLHEALVQLKPAGIIAHAFNDSVAHALKGLEAPVVNVSRNDPGQGFPAVNIEETTIGSMAAEHLMDCGLRHFAYFGPSRYGPDTGREGGFYQALARISHTIDTYHATYSPFDPGDTTSASVDETRNWVRGLPKPVGIFTPGDTWSMWLSDICRQEGLRVPDEIAIMGVDNDELLCELAQPSLSSVAIPSERVGFEASAMLERLMAGAAPPREPFLLAPLGVVVRQSTDVLALEDPDMAAATRYMREHALEPISVSDVLDQVMISRRSLERMFRTTLGRSPSEEIRRLRIVKARSLLSQTDLQMPEIARRSGFSSAKQLATVFHQVTGMTPSTYRRELAMGDARPGEPAHLGAPKRRPRSR